MSQEIVGWTTLSGAAASGVVLLGLEPTVTAMRRRCEQSPKGANAPTVLRLRNRQRKLAWKRRSSLLMPTSLPAARGIFILVVIDVIICTVHVCVRRKRISMRKGRGT